MKFTTIYLGDNKIELFNSLLGKETVKVNGEVVSEQYSMSGTEHIFSIYENDRESVCKLVTGFGKNGVVFDLYKDDQPIIESPKSSLLFWVIFGAAFFVGFLFSVLA
ncbi:MAG: hypothetical protein AAF960_04135 [Bacteroidota bacterium]